MRRALLVGIDNYPMSPLSGCVGDATRVRDLLVRNEDDTPNFDCRLLTSPPDNVGRPDLRKAIVGLFKDQADVVLLHFSGHGIISNDAGYLVTQDAGNYDEGIPMQEVLTLAGKSPAKEVVILLDCCHSGHFGQIPVMSEGTAVLREGISVLTSSRSSQTSKESPDGGVFTSLVRGALNGGAADVCGNVTVAGIYAYLDQALGAWDQRPLFKAHVTRFVPLRRCEPGMDREILRRLSVHFTSPDFELPLDPSYEPTAEPKNPENEAVFADLQQLRAARLLVPIGERHLYYAAMNSKSCRLTPSGRFYWRLAKDGRL